MCELKRLRPLLRLGHGGCTEAGRLEAVGRPLAKRMTAAATQQQQDEEVTAAAAALHIPPLDHGAIGNGRVLALVSPTSAIEWLCLPRFDSPSVFARLIDAQRGGTFRFLYGEREVRGHLRYVANTNVLSTRFEAVSYTHLTLPTKRIV